MARPSAISLPQLPDGVTPVRTIIENHILDVIKDIFDGNNIHAKKYYKTANEQIYTDLTNQLQSGVPQVWLRTVSEDTTEANPEERMDSKTCSIEIIFSVPVKIEKGLNNVDRYVYTLEHFVREGLRNRENMITTIPGNRRRPFIYNGNRDIFRDNEVDIMMSDFNVEYILK